MFINCYLTDCREAPDAFKYWMLEIYETYCAFSLISALKQEKETTTIEATTVAQNKIDWSLINDTFFLFFINGLIYTLLRNNLNPGLPVSKEKHEYRR